MILGEMEIVGRPPAKFAKALACIAHDLHETFDKQGWLAPGKSKESCVLASLAVRDFLWKVGFKDAACASVLFLIRAYRGDEELHSLGIGVTDQPNAPEFIPGRWNGHLVVQVPSAGYLIDTTLYQAARPQWKGLLGMIAVPLETAPDEPMRGLMPLAGLAADESGDKIVALWLHQPGNKTWRGKKSDCDKWRRAAVIKQLVARFGRWEE